jgi:hypothetical protein
VKQLRRDGIKIKTKIQTDIEILVFHEAFKGETRERGWEITCARSRKRIMRFEINTIYMHSLLVGKAGAGLEYDPGSSSLFFIRDETAVVVQVRPDDVATILFGSGLIDGLTALVVNSPDPRIGHRPQRFSVAKTTINAPRIPKNPQAWLAYLIRKGQVDEKILELDESKIDVYERTSNYGMHRELLIDAWPVRVMGEGS